VPAATSGLVYPVWAMVAMALSVTTIFANSLWGRPSLLFDALRSVGRRVPPAPPRGPTTATPRSNRALRPWGRTATRPPPGERTRRPATGTSRTGQRIKDKRMSTLIHLLTPIGLSLEVGLIFFYKALWSILFGVAVTAAIDVFVDKTRMARLLGGRDVKTTGLATVAGAVSSACTFGAVSIAQTLFKKGASAEATFAFALASTNIVFELAILIYVLLGPAFVAAELLSGVVLVAIMYLLVRATLPIEVFAQARRRMQEREGEFQFVHAGQERWWQQLKTLRGWSYIATRYFRTIGRIYRSVIVGFLISGFIVVLVPKAFWSSIFLPPNGVLGVLENAALGVLVGIFSFIGSIGIVPFAAALWIGGAGFAGVLGCLIADNITVPVLNVWRTFYGGKATAYIVAVFYVTMVAASVLVAYLFRALRWIPRPQRSAARLTAAGIHLDDTLVLTLLFLGLTGALWIVKGIGDRRLAPEQEDAQPLRETQKKRESA